MEAIWAEGIDTRNATFETETPSWSSFDASRHPDHRHVALLDDLVVGWATLSPVSRRPCYTGVAENSVYVTSKARNQGIGLALMEALVTKADASRIWTIQTSVFPENRASLAEKIRLLTSLRPTTTRQASAATRLDLFQTSSQRAG